MPSIEFLMLANYAESHNNMLYISGGGWSDVFRAPPDPDGQVPVTHFGIATRILIPWEETNAAHQFVISIERDDGTELGKVGDSVTLGRPPHLEEGTVQTVAFGVAADVAFPETGNHTVTAKIGDDTRSVNFRVHDQAAQALQQS